MVQSMRGYDMLTKKDFKAVMDAIDSVTLMAMEPGGTIGTPEERVNLRDGVDIARSQIADNLADYFATQNSLFDRDRFMKACGLK